MSYTDKLRRERIQQRPVVGEGSVNDVLWRIAELLAVIADAVTEDEPE